MKTINVAILMSIGIALSACSNLGPVKQDLACFKDTVVQASNGDFSQWTLPSFVPGTHHVPPQIADCMYR